IGVKRFTSCWPASAQSTWLRVGLFLVTAGYAGINARDLHERLARAPHEGLAALYARPTADGQPLLKWVELNTDVGDTLIAVDGQATGYLLHRPTVTLVKSQYSPVRWECEEVKNQLTRFNSSYVILYKPSASTVYNDYDEFLSAESRFVATSVSQQPPCGFVIAAENSYVRILKIDGAERASQN